MTDSGRGDPAAGVSPPEGAAVTEAEWLACADPLAMMTALRGATSGRKLRLLACATARERRGDAPDQRCLGVIEVAERYADGTASDAEREAAFRAAAPHAIAVRRQSGGEKQWVFPFLTAYAVGTGAGDYSTHLNSGSRHRSPATIRDIFGNPFRPVAFAPEWRTDTAVSLARDMYESRGFSAMPILADALQDAGCDAPDILAHCRDTSLTHVRGCWVTDLVLGKS